MRLEGVKNFSVGICDGAPSTARSSCIFVNFLCGILGQVWFLIVSIPDLASFLTLTSTIVYDAILCTY